jgi:peroxiredoxin
LGSTAPPFELPDVHGRRHALSQWRGRRLALIFFDPRCSFCVQMAPRLARLPSEAAAGMPVPLVIAAGSAEENRRLLEKHGIRCLVLLQERTEVAWAYGAPGTPTGCLVDEHGAIASELASGAQAVLAMTGLSAGDVGTAPEGQERADSDARLHLAPNGPRP